MRKSIAVMLSVLTLGALAAGPLVGIAEADYSAQWVAQGAKIAQIGTRKYAEWECTLGGGVVAAGIFWVWLTPVSAVGATLAGASFTAGCELGAPKNYYYLSGAPVETKNICWEVYPRRSFARRFTTCIA